MTKLVRCTCTHIFQDEMYGVGNRMANEMRTGQFVCTVCSTIHGGSQGITQTEKVQEKVAAKESANKQEQIIKEKLVRRRSLKGGKR